MNDLSRKHILNRLSAAHAKELPRPQTLEWKAPGKLSQDEKIQKLKSLMESVRTEIHLVSSENWLEVLKDLLRKRGFKTIVYAPNSEMGSSLAKEWGGATSSLPLLVPYDRPLEDFKETLFEIEAGITSTAGGVAETGALILLPDENEPRLMSLVPPVHLAVLKAAKIHDTLAEAMKEEGWAERMPTNLLLISGPSKTADIELTLAFGVHGPKELIVFILLDEVPGSY
jgi:L-lactate dehydrogenase complex protein LldG